MSSNPSRDIDFAMWGPFTSPSAPCVTGLTAAKRVACSYSTSSTESGTISNAKSGEYYVILITNFSNRATDITFSQTGGSGTSNCDILCNITGLTATPGSCGSGANLGKYNITGTVTAFTPPTTGTLTVKTSYGDSVTFSAPFSSPLSYTLPYVTGNSSTAFTVTATYSAVTTCTKSVSVTPPVCCTVTPTSSSITTCVGSTINLTSTGTTGGVYHWSGPNGFTSSLQSPSISNANLTHSGTYSVYLTNGSCTSSVATVTVTVKPLPTASISAGGPITFCQNDSVVLSAPSGTGYTYQWLRNGSSISGATSATYSAKTAGSYTVTVSQAGCSPSSATSTATSVTVNSLPTATITAPVTTICQGDSATLTANAGTGYTYKWMIGPTFISGATNSTYVVYTAGGYGLTVTDANGCSKLASAKNITVNSLPPATISQGSLATYCSGGSVTLNANTGTGLTYAWKKNGSSISGTGSSKLVNSAGDYTVTVTRTSTGCSATSAITTVMQGTTATASITANGVTSFCQGDSVVLEANEGIGFTYQWKLNGTDISGATDTTYSAKASGSYSVVVTQSGCTPPSATSSTVSVTVTPLPPATIAASGPITFCAGDSVVLTTNTGSGISDQWRLNGVNLSGATGSSYTAKVSGDYTVKVTKSGCSAITPVKTVTVNALPVANISTSGAPTTFCIGDSVILSATAGSGYTYIWKSGGTNISGATTQTYTAKTNGNYTVVITDGNGCVSTPSGITTVTANPYPLAVVTALGSTTFCQGSSVDLDVSKGTGYTYQWKLNGGNISGATNFLYTATQAGTYVVTVTLNSCSLTSSSTTVTVNPKPTTSLIYHR